MEYALILSLIAMAIIALVTSLGNMLKGSLHLIAGKFWFSGLRESQWVLSSFLVKEGREAATILSLKYVSSWLAVGPPLEDRDLIVVPFTRPRLTLFLRVTVLRDVPRRSIQWINLPTRDASRGTCVRAISR